MPVPLSRYMSTEHHENEQERCRKALLWSAREAVMVLGAEPTASASFSFGLDWKHQQGGKTLHRLLGSPGALC